MLRQVRSLFIERSARFLRYLLSSPARFGFLRRLLAAKPLVFEQRRYAEAGKLSESAQAILEKAFGPEHPDVAESLCSRAGLKVAQVRHGWIRCSCHDADTGWRGTILDRIILFLLVFVLLVLGFLRACLRNRSIIFYEGSCRDDQVSPPPPFLVLFSSRGIAQGCKPCPKGCKSCLLSASTTSIASSNRVAKTCIYVKVMPRTLKQACWSFPLCS